MIHTNVKWVDAKGQEYFRVCKGLPALEELRAYVAAVGGRIEQESTYSPNGRKQ